MLSFRTCCCNQRLVTPSTTNEAHSSVPDHKIAPQRSVCPEQLYYHMHKNVYCFISHFSVKVNRNWPGVASQILTVELEAQHKYRGASECKCLLWILESSSAWAAQVCVYEEPSRRCVQDPDPSPGTCLHAGFQHSHMAVSATGRNSNADRHRNRQSISKLLNKKLIQSFWYLILGGNFSQIYLQDCGCPPSNNQIQEIHLSHNMLQIPD